MLPAPTMCIDFFRLVTQSSRVLLDVTDVVAGHAFTDRTSRLPSLPIMCFDLNYELALHSLNTFMLWLEDEISL